eukprot:m.1648947 g.1648947  ORF g.1648947 m.1648947 type:complete len:56 (+) comp81363_c0_seq1:99-266(+)
MWCDVMLVNGEHSPTRTTATAYELNIVHKMQSNNNLSSTPNKQLRTNALKTIDCG